MRLMNHAVVFAVAIIFSTAISGCGDHSSLVHQHFSSPDVLSIPTNPLYVVVMNVETSFGKKNELVVMDGNTFDEINRTRLMDRTLIFKFSQDPLGRIWIGYAGTLENYTQRVDIFSPYGLLLQSLETCGYPNREIQFVDGHAFVPCERNGFRAQMAAINLESLAIEKMIDLTAEPRFSLLSAAANTESVLAIGGSKTHATGIVLDPQRLKIKQYIPLYGGANIFTIIVNEDRFYLLNRGSSFSPDNPIDLRMIHIAGEPEITEYKLAVRDPVLGFIDGEFLWAYHQPIAEKAETSFWAITRTHLATGKSDYWPLPDYWWAGDMIALNGKIVLTRRDSADPNETDGLYEFSPETGQLTQILELPGAHLLLAPHGQGESSGDGTE